MYLIDFTLCLYFHAENSDVGLPGASIKGDDDVAFQTFVQHFLLIASSQR